MTRNMAQYQKPTGKCRRKPAGRRERTVSRARRCRSMHGSTRSSSRPCSVVREPPRHHSRAFPGTYRVRGLKSCSSSGAVYQRTESLPQKVLVLASRGVHLSPASNFFSRNSVILACSAAARRSSVSESCWRRCCSAPSISSEVLPVAQIMKIKPNFSS